MNLMRISYVALLEIPEAKRRLLHRMYEDNDLQGAENADELINFLELEVPGAFVGFQANDSVSPPCTYTDGHYHCDHDDPYWSIVLVSTETWRHYKDIVMKKDKEYMHRFTCKIAKTSSNAHTEAGELWDGEKWIKSLLVPFGYYAKGLEYLPEPLANTSYYTVDEDLLDSH